MERCKLEVALYIGESDFNDSAFVSILSRTPTLMIHMTALPQTPVFLLVCSSWREVELRCYKDYRVWMLQGAVIFYQRPVHPKSVKQKLCRYFFFSFCGFFLCNLSFFLKNQNNSKVFCIPVYTINLHKVNVIELACRQVVRKCQYFCHLRSSKFYLLLYVILQDSACDDVSYLC